MNMHRYVRTNISLLLILSLLGVGIAVTADDDNDTARRLQESGDIISLEVILDNLRSSHPGKILEVELEKKAGQVVYEIEMLDEDGIVHEMIIDAKTGELLHSKQDD